MNKKSLMISLITIVGVICILVGSIAYYRITVNGSIKGSTGNAVFNVTGFTNESTKEITLKEGKLIPGDKGLFTLTLDATSSDVDMYVTLSIDKGTLPTNLKFYTTSDYKAELHKYYEFMDTSNQTKDITIYWYWNPYISDEEDSNFVNNTDVTATIKLDAVQISEYAMMKNGNAVTFDENYNPTFNGTEFWSDTYRNNIKTIKFINDLSNLPEVCNEENLCFDVTEAGSHKKVYAYLIDSGIQGIVGQDDNNGLFIYENLYNLYIVSETPIFAPIDCSYMFYSFINLVTIDFNNNFNTSLTTNMEGMFEAGGYYYNPGALPTSYIPNDKNKVELLDNVDDVKSSLMSNEKAFSGRTNLVELDLSSFNTSNVASMERMFSGCKSLTSLDLSSFNTSNVTDMKYMFISCKSLTSLDLSSFNTSNVTSMTGMFYKCSSLTSLNLSSFNTSNVTTMESMFSGCESLTSLDLSSFNTSNVTDMKYMFISCKSLTSLDLSSFNTSNVTDMSYMFWNCETLTSLDLSNFNTSKVTNMRYMFELCSSLTSLDLSGFNTSNVTTMHSMFSDCSSLTSLDLSSFNTSNVTSMTGMFYKCSSLTSLNLSSFNTSNVTTMESMFKYCYNLTTTINIMSASITTYFGMFKDTSTKNGACITVNYIADTSTLVDYMIATKSETSNVVKGVQL